MWSETQGGETHALGVQLSNIYRALPQAGVAMAGGAGGTGSPPTPGRGQAGLTVSSPHPSSMTQLLFFDTQRNKPYSYLTFVFI